MKILLVGDWHSELHEALMEKSLISLGHEVISFKWNKYFQNANGHSNIYQKFQNKYLFGPTIRKMNLDLIACVNSERPCTLFVYRGTHIYPKTLEIIKKRNLDTLLVGYNNDDPFSYGYKKRIWRHFLKSLCHYDLMFAYRHKNLKDFRNAGVRHTHLLRSWFDPERNYPEKLHSECDYKYKSDVTFIGHYEKDGRLAVLEDVVKRGWDLKIYGPGYEWDKGLEKSKYLRHLAPINLVWGNEYNKAICGAKICLCFLSKLNNDTYTRRCFEIPACGTLLMSEKTADLTNLYAENNEAVFFETLEEFGCKLDQLLGRQDEINRIATNGMSRVWDDGHDIASRMKFFLRTVENVKREM